MNCICRGFAIQLVWKDDRKLVCTSETMPVTNHVTAVVSVSSIMEIFTGHMAGTVAISSMDWADHL